MDKKIERILHDDIELLPLPLNIVITHLKFIDFTFYLTQDKKKFFKIRPGIDAMEEMLIRYKSNGLENIYLSEKHFKSFLQNIQKELSSKFFDPKTKEQSEISDESKLMTLNSAYGMLKESLGQFGFSSKNLDLAQEINKTSIILLKNAPNIFNLFKKFKNNANQAFLDAMLSGFTATCLVNTYVWKNDKIVEKLTLSAILSDILLSTKDHDIIESCDGNYKSLPENIKSHPLVTAKKLSKYPTVISPEIVECVGLHHELPNGTGFPRNLAYSNLGQLPCVLIISQFFATELRKIDFDYTKKDILKAKLVEMFDVPNFKNHLNALIEIIDS